MSSKSAVNTNAGAPVDKRYSSFVWDYFVKVPGTYGRAACQVCNSTLSNLHQTSNLILHLRRKHPDIYAEAKEKERLKNYGGIKNRQAVQAKSKRGRGITSITKGKRESVVWHYYTQTEPGEVNCNLCGGSLRYMQSSTSGLLRHLQRKHPSVYLEALGKQRMRSGELLDTSVQDIISSPVSGSTDQRNDSCHSDQTQPSNTISDAVIDNISSSPSKLIKSSGPRKSKSAISDITIEKTKDRVNKSLIKLISVNLLPPSIVEIKEFKEMLKALDSRYELPTKTAVLKTLIPEFAEEVKKKFKADVDSASHFALTVETWTYRHGQKCVTVMAHFIKDSWETSAVALETIDSPEDNACGSLFQELRRITDEWGISDKVVSLVSEDSEILSTAAETMGWEFLFCFGEKLNNAIMTALELVPEVSRILRRVNKVVEYFDRSVKASEILLSVQQQHNIPENSLKTEVENKWISTYRMMERMSEQFEAANTVLCYHGQDDMCLCDEDIALLRSVIDILQPFEAIVTESPCNEYSCMSKVIPVRNVLQEVLGNFINDSSAEPSAPLSSLCDSLLQQMEAKFGTFEMNSTLALCTLLDPRFKHHAFTDSSAVEVAQDKLLQEMKSIAGSSSSLDEVLEKPAIKEEESGDDSSNCKKKKIRILSTVWNFFDKRVSEAGARKSVSSEMENESRRFFKEALISRDQDPLKWWKLNQVQFPHLHVLAKKYLCIPATSMCSSRLYSGQGEKLNSRRKMVKPRDLNAMIFLASNIL